ncbi:MAG: hypothetical protein HOU01_06360, partial [Streptomycetaceae bacterium]|nr:hypothetical protein [Streptomycetaceae bacterium]
MSRTSRVLPETAPDPGGSPAGGAVPADAGGPLFGPRLAPPLAWLPRDVLLSVFLGALQIVGTFGAARGQRHTAGLRDLDALAVVLACIGPLLLLVRRRYPVPVLIASVLPPLVYALRDYPPGPVYLSLVVALFTAMTAGHRTVSYV